MWVDNHLYYWLESMADGLYTIDGWIIAFCYKKSFIMATCQWDKQRLILFVFSTFQTHIVLLNMGIYYI